MVARDQAGKHAFELTAAEVRETIEKIDEHNPVRGLLLGLMDKAEPEAGELGQRVAEWFDAGMDRVAGWYKRQVKYFLLAVAAVVTVAVNADTMRSAEQLWMDDAQRGEIAAAAQEAVAENDLGAALLRRPRSGVSRAGCGEHSLRRSGVEDRVATMPRGRKEAVPARCRRSMAPGLGW